MGARHHHIMLKKVEGEWQIFARCTDRKADGAPALPLRVGDGLRRRACGNCWTLDPVQVEEGLSC